MVGSQKRCVTQVASFDVFDTVLTRRVGNPRSAFLLLGQRLANKGLIACSAEAFARHRTSAEVRSFRNAGGLDSTVDIDRIYAELGSSLRIAGSRLDKLIAEELDLESDLLVPLREGVDLLAERPTFGPSSRLRLRHVSAC